jgi:hypothetical protein
MEFLVTGDAFKTFWKYKDGTVRRHNFPKYEYIELATRSTTDYSFDLPLELRIVIMKRMFTSLLISRNFELAFDLCCVSKDFAMIVYRQIYGRDSIDAMEGLRRLVRTFYLIESIDDEYLSKENLEDFTRVGLKLTSRYPSLANRIRPLVPWDHVFQMIELVDGIVDDSGDLTTHTTGEYYGDIVWSFGNHEEGIFKVSTLMHPIICIMLVDHTGNLTSTEKKFRRCAHFHGFVKLLRYIYGNQAGIYFMVKDNNNMDNPFITHTELFITV